MKEKFRCKAARKRALNFNFKDILAKQGTQAAEQVKKQEEEKAKFEGMKTHFTAGTALLDQERKAKDDAAKGSG